MAGRLTNQIRIEQTRSTLEALQTEITTWLAKRRKKDTLQQYHTQLHVLERVLSDSLAHFREMLNSVADTQPSGDVYMACRSYDKSLLQLRRIWSYFQSKFDQRDDPALALVLAGADELAWSCYTEVFRNLTADESHPEVVRRTTPLPYIEADYSPRAIPRDKPGNLNTDVELRKQIQQLPIPIVSLPPLCVQEPWWLIYMGHEIGHHIQHDLLPDTALIPSFGRLLYDVVHKARRGEAQAPQDEEDEQDEQAEHWESWKEEIFADLCSLHSLGPSAVRAIVELELADEKAMLARKSGYPPSVVRLELLASAVAALGMDRRDALGNLQLEELLQGPPLPSKDGDLRQLASRDAAIAHSCIAEILTTPLLDSYNFGDLYNWDAALFASDGRADSWKQELLAPYQPDPEMALEAPRVIISGALAAWESICTLADTTQRKELSAQLTHNLLAVLKDSREEGVRAVSQVAEPDITELGDQLAQQILYTSTASLEDSLES